MERIFLTRVFKTKFTIKLFCFKCLTLILIAGAFGDIDVQPCQ